MGLDKVLHRVNLIVSLMSLFPSYPTACTVALFMFFFFSLLDPCWSGAHVFKSLETCTVTALQVYFNDSFNMVQVVMLSSAATNYCIHYLAMNSLNQDYINFEKALIFKLSSSFSLFLNQFLPLFDINSYIVCFN